MLIKLFHAVFSFFTGTLFVFYSLKYWSITCTFGKSEKLQKILSTVKRKTFKNFILGKMVLGPNEASAVIFTEIENH